MAGQDKSKSGRFSKSGRIAVVARGAEPPLLRNFFDFGCRI